MAGRYEKAVFYSDFHAPYEDGWCLKIAEQFNRYFKPAWVFVLGDLVDFYQLSKFDKNPARMDDLQADLDAGRSVLERLRSSVSDKCKIVYCEGNHEARLRKWLWSHPEVSSLKALTLPELLTLSRYGVEFVDSLTDYDYHGWSLEHGLYVRKHSGYSARAQMEARGCSGISGHTHRLGTHYLTNRGGDFVWIENGCMCSRKPEWLRSVNWQNGFTVGWFKRSNHRFTFEQQCIPDGKCVYHGREFGRC